MATPFRRASGIDQITAHVGFLVFGLLGLLYDFFGEEIIEFDSQKLSIRKGIDG